MAMVNSAAGLLRCCCSNTPPRRLLPLHSPSSSHPVNTRLQLSTPPFPGCAVSRTEAKRALLPGTSSASKDEAREPITDANFDMDGTADRPGGTLLCSFSPLPLLFLTALPGAGTVRSLFGPFVELVKTLSLPDWLVHWGHPGNMAVVLFAMGGYGTYLGFRIKFSDDVEEKAKAKDLHPKLLGGMFFFFALGATGGVTALLTSDKPIFESPHAVTGFIGLTLLTVQTVLPSLFEGNPGLRNVHGILGSGIMTLFLIHAALGLRLGLSF
ncbi:uncharacterized protein LOC115674172 isoform X1 [Syzygium oleosum]|uniref:uncharacterized protein LOC115674172 isoform X1 n=1 Tax=Syzygium oleosum TaxID=219896 RepID=UPI0011D1DC60|nr:uncharacterized protein LOC115674172 isoform X1 [Syzygium oleosum]